MGSNTLLQKESKSHTRSSSSVKYDIVGAIYLHDYVLLVTFASGEQKEIDFAAALEKYAQGYYSKYKKLDNFKKFKIENKNIVWGKDWDLIFKPETIYTGKF